MSTNILITGTPAVGKSTIAKFLKEKTGAFLIDISELIKKKRLHIRKCDKYDTLEYLPEKVAGYLKRKLNPEKSYIIDTHDPECVSSFSFDLVVVLTADLSILSKRYTERGYNSLKKEENLEVEIMEVVYNDVIELFPLLSSEHILRISTTENKQPRSLEDIYRDISSSLYWPFGCSK